MTTPRTGSKRMKAAPKKGKVGLRETASAANVSVATASRVHNRNTRVARDIQKVVLDETRKLVIDPVQRNKTKALAFLLSDRAMLQFPQQLGKQLVELVLKRIAKPDQTPQCVMIPIEFIKRDSCGPPVLLVSKPSARPSSGPRSSE